MGNSAKPGIIILIMGILGLILAACIQIAFDNGWVSGLWFEAADVLGLQILTIVVFMLMGGILAAISS